MSIMVGSEINRSFHTEKEKSLLLLHCFDSYMDVSYYVIHFILVLVCMDYKNVCVLITNAFEHKLSQSTPCPKFHSINT